MIQLHSLLLDVEGAAKSFVCGKFIGICGIVAVLHQRAGGNNADYELVNAELHRLFSQWPHFSGNLQFPVPHRTEEPGFAFKVAANLWADDEYGNMRKNLLHFLIERTKP